MCGLRPKDSTLRTIAHDVSCISTGDLFPSFLLALALLASSVALGEDGATPKSKDAPSEWRSKIPILSVNSEHQGSCARVDLSVRRRESNKSPLSVAVVEDTPSGADQTVRSSVWMAAMVAALSKHDDLPGVVITLEIPGIVEGSSAGGVVCLAILSALDGKEFPNDVAMTGAILPDGSIGIVGGIAAKMRGAAGAGIKRFIMPAVLRFEKDPQTKEDVDLKELGRSLKLQLLPVRNIVDAYSAAHNLPKATRVLPDHSVFSAPTAVDEYFKTAYKEAMAAGLSIWNALPEKEREQLQNDDQARRTLVLPRLTAERAFASGRLVFACNQAEIWAMVLEARRENSGPLRAITATTPRGLMAEVDKITLPMIGALKAPQELIWALGAKLPDIGLQFTMDVIDTQAMLGLLQPIEAKIETAMGQIEKLGNEEGTAEQRKSICDAAWDVKVLESLLAKVALLSSERITPSAQRLCASMPKMSLSPKATAVERLFRAAYLASDSYFEANVVTAYAKGANIEVSQVRTFLGNIDTDWFPYFICRDVLMKLADPPSKGPLLDDPKRVSAIAACNFAYGIAAVNALIVKYSELDLDITPNGELRYGATDVLSSMLTTSREQAIEAVHQCLSKGIPCISALQAFENAEMERDDSETDKVRVLTAYWQASIEANAMQMLFTINEN